MPALTTDRRFLTCERMATPAPKPATPERRDIRISGTGELVGQVVVSAWSIVAWGYDADGKPLLLWEASRTDTDANLIAASRIWSHYERTRLMAPKHLRYVRRAA